MTAVERADGEGDVVTIEEARAEYADWATTLIVLAGHHGREDYAWIDPLPECEPCHHAGIRVEAASLAYDNAIALQYAGPRPRLAARALGVAW